MKSTKPGPFDAEGTSPEDAAHQGTTDPSLSRRDGARRDALMRTLESEIVPRLLMMSKSAAPAKSRVGARVDAMEAGDVEQLARLLLHHGPAAAHEFVEVVRRRGIPYERICIDLLVPVAHRLAERWERRELSYPQLTVGLNALQSVVAGIGNAAESGRASHSATH